MAEGGLASDPKDFLMCDKHPNEKAAIYCEHHIVVCCMSCAWEDHHDCKPKPCKLEDAVGKFHDEQSDWVEQLNICSDSSETIIDSLKENIQSLEEAESDYLGKFASIKDDIMTKLTQLEQQFTSDIEKCISNKTKKMKNTLERMEQQKKNLDKTRKDIDELLKSKNPGIVVAFVKSKSLIKSCDLKSEIKVSKPRLKISKELQSFLDCTSIGKLISDDSNYENVILPGNIPPVPPTHGNDSGEEDETIMSDFLQEDKGARPRPPKQERSGITFGKIFRMFKFRSSPQAPERKSATNPVPLPLAASGNIDDEEWFHGDISREIASARLIGNGDYLLRSKTNQVTGNRDYVLSVCSKIQHHAFIRSVKGGWKFKGRRFSTMVNLIKHLHQTMTPLISASHKVVLHTPVPSKPLTAEEAIAPETLQRHTSCIAEDEDGYADVFDVGEKVMKESIKKEKGDCIAFRLIEIPKERVMAAYDFSSRESDDLPFKKGEVLEVLSKDEHAEWWKARNKHGQTGFIPMNYISKIQEPVLTTEPEDLSDVEGNDESSTYELWAPPPSAMPEYEYSCDIKEIQWFHGKLPRENAEKRLANDGDFLVREHIQNNDKVEYIISVFWKGPRHFKYKKTLYTQPHNPVEYYVGNEVPITEATEVMLRNPILRESWEIRNNDIELQNKCDFKDFGDVYTGHFKSMNEKVSLNLARDDMTEEDKKLFLGEAQILCQFQHPNIVRYFGIAMDFDPVMIVMEHITGNSLLTFLRDGHKVDAIRNIEICIDVANAIDYLQEKKCIHRNIAARSCLFGDGGSVKLADFSFCSKLDPLRLVRGSNFRVPLKWTAPEVVSSEDFLNSFCLKSDIWSFGILLWEIYSNGNVPYPGDTNRKAIEHILQGQRMSAPKDTPPFIAEIMTRCWNEEPNRRPNIKHILQWLKSASKSQNIENFKLPPLPPPAPSRTVPPPPGRTLPPPPPGSSDGITSEKSFAARNSGPPPLPKIEDRKKRPLPPPPPSSKEGANKLAKEFERKLQRRPPPPIPTEPNGESDEDDDCWDDE